MIVAVMQIACQGAMFDNFATCIISDFWHRESRLNLMSFAYKDLLGGICVIEVLLATMVCSFCFLLLINLMEIYSRSL